VFDEKAKTDPNKYGDMGEVGPPLDGIAERYDEGQLRLLLVDAKQVYPDTIMPAFYKVEGLHRVLPEYEGKPILNAQEIEDVLSFLMTLK
jgi:sulfur-oxidizing protein SoxX